MLTVMVAETPSVAVEMVILPHTLSVEGTGRAMAFQGAVGSPSAITTKIRACYCPYCRTMSRELEEPERVNHGQSSWALSLHFNHFDVDFTVNYRPLLGIYPPVQNRVTQ